jgi:hypothetical protein
MKTLLVTSVPPNKSFSGTLLTWHLTKNFTSETLACFFAKNKHLAHINAEFYNPGTYEQTSVPKSREVALRHKRVPKLISTPVSIAREIYRCWFEIPALAREVLKKAAEVHADKIWIILEGQTMIWLAEKLIKKSSLPVYTQVWDAPQWWADANRLDRFSSRAVFKSFHYCIQNSKQFGSASFNMSKLLKDKFGRDSFPLIGITPASTTESRPDQKDDSKFIIGIAGQIYASETFNALIHALDTIYWVLDGRTVEIHYWGNSYIKKKRTRIIRRPYVPQEELIAQLKTCDILYCPYWFEGKFAEVAKTSFPSKITSYLNSGVVMMFHGPRHSSPASLLEEHQAALCCYSENVELIKMCLRKALYSPQVPQIVRAASDLANGCLSERALHQNFRKFLEMGAP